MRPRLTLWSDYGTSARKYRASAAMRGARSSLARKCLLAAAIVVAAAIASCELFGQAADKMPDAAGGHTAKRDREAVRRHRPHSAIAATFAPCRRGRGDRSCEHRQFGACAFSDPGVGFRCAGRPCECRQSLRFRVQWPRRLRCHRRLRPSQRRRLSRNPEASVAGGMCRSSITCVTMTPGSSFGTSRQGSVTAKSSGPRCECSCNIGGRKSPFLAAAHRVFADPPLRGASIGSQWRQPPSDAPNRSSSRPVPCSRAPASS